MDVFANTAVGIETFGTFHTGVSCGVRCLQGLTWDKSFPSAVWFRKDLEKRPKFLNFGYSHKGGGYHAHLHAGFTYIFSDADIYKNGIRAAEFIKGNGLGEIVEVGPVKNPSGGNIIRTWVWIYNGKTLDEQTC